MSSGECVSAKIFRFDPSRDEKPRYDTVEVPMDPDMRVLDVLDYAVENFGLGFAYRWFCGVKRCGLCGVSVNGKPVLACWEKARPSMVIEPLPNLPVIRDLVVDRSGVESATLELEPCLDRKDPYETFPEPVTHTEMEDAFELMNCIECYVCTASCPVLAETDNRDFVGPAALVQLAKVALHPKDGADRVASALKGDIYACVSCYECSNVCPVGINVLEDAIEKLKRKCAARPEASPGARHAMVFTDVVRERGRIHPPTLMRRSKGLTESVKKTDLAFTMYRKGKVQGRAKSIRKAEDIKTLFDAVENVE